MLGLVFVNAWTSQFFVKTKEGLSGAKDLSETIATWSMFCGIVMGAIIGYKIDGRNKRIIPWFFACFCFRALGLFFMTVIIDDYQKDKQLLYASFLAMQSGTFIQTIVVQGMINKRLIAPIKEIMNGVG